VTPSEAWDVYVGTDSPRDWWLQDVYPYVATAPTCDDLDDDERAEVASLLLRHIEEQ